MTTPQLIDDFVAGKTLAMVGISAGGKGFGNVAYKELKRRGYHVLPVHPRAAEIQGDRCWPSLAALPETVERLLVMVQAPQLDGVLRQAADAGIKQVWLQQGAGEAPATDVCARAGMHVVHGECILMYAEPVGSIHRVHRWLWQLIGKAPKRTGTGTAAPCRP